LAYFDAMIDILIANYQVDERLVFATGWSNGADMVYRLICEMADRIAGAAPFAGVFGNKNATDIKCISEDGTCN